jgi:rubrerythrin
MYLSRETILTISLEIERKGIDFYRKMKERFDDDFLDYLIDQEKDHIRTFNELFAADSGKIKTERFETTTIDDDFIAAAYAGTEVFGAIDPKGIPETQLFDIAMEMEKNSILFYGELVETLGEKFKDEAALITALREEEKKHLRTLVDKKKALTA